MLFVGRWFVFLFLSSHIDKNLVCPTVKPLYIPNLYSRGRCSLGDIVPQFCRKFGIASKKLGGTCFFVPRCGMHLRDSSDNFLSPLQLARVVAVVVLLVLVLVCGYVCCCGGAIFNLSWWWQRRRRAQETFRKEKMNPSA